MAGASTLGAAAERIRQPASATLEDVLYQMN